MKTILYNPIFINPQAYYVFPRLTRYLQPDNESTAEPANYIGTIEVKVIAYGDTTLKRTYTNTDSIDLSEFKNTWIRISLFTKVGSCVLGEWKIGNMESDLPYIDPEVLASLKAVVIVGNKTNNDSDRAIVKNLVDPDNPFVISNAAFKLNSGFGKYEITFQYFPYIENVTNVSDSKVVFGIGGQLLIPYSAITENIPSFKIKVNGLSGTYHFRYYYRSSDGVQHSVNMAQDGYYELPICYNVQSSSDGTDCGFANNGNDVVTITQIPSFEGAFVTDGVDDLITSTKTVQEMGITEACTVISMIHQIDLNSTYTIATTNYIENSNSREHVRSDVYNYGKTGIYGYSASLINNTKSDIKNILGDEADYYVKSTNSLQTIFDAKFSVVGRISELTEASQVAWYWTIIANKVLTTDQINQVIAYFNLDRTLNPDILCNTIKQGITNENHAEFGDKLIDFSGNGRDIQLNNIAWKGDSGIGRYETELSNTSIWTQSKETTSSPFSSSYNGLSGWIVFANTELTNSADMPSFKIQVKGLLEGQELIYRYYDSTGQSNVYSMDKDGEYTLPSDVRTAKPQISNTSGFQVVKNEANIITITQIPSHAGALCLDGVNDFGKVTGMPVYKDYTVIADYIRISAKENAQDSPILSKSKVAGSGAFLFNYLNADSVTSSFSFGTHNALKEINDFERKIYYLSKYASDGYNINAGYAVDYDTMWLGAYRDNAQNFFNGAIYSLMSFPYSMSKFLIERQLKKHKLGTLYPNMVEFRPVIKANANYKITYYQIDSTNTWKSIKVGDYIVIGAKLAFQITFDNDASELKEVVSPQLSGIIVEKRPSNPGYNIYSYITSKSPQKINITIDEYIRFEDIVQPYPVLLRFKDENGNEVSWGGKFRVGSTITRIGSIADPESNLLNGLYSISGLSLNGKAVTSSTSIVEKQMVFRTTATWLLDNNEPKVILSPSRLRIPNSSYKLLGYIPDISGHGNHGVIHNSAYEGMSGANGYPYDYKNSSFWADSILAKVISGELVEYFAVKNSTGFSNITSGVYKGEIKVTGVTKAISENKISLLRIFTNSTTDKEIIDITQDGNYNIDIKGVGDANRVFFYAIPNNPNESIVVHLTEPIRIEQVGEYEGAYCLDGVDDFVTIPTLSSGGKQVLMKVNWNTIDSIIYDQRGSGGFAIYCSDYNTIGDSITVPAYKGRNAAGTTYIDGIRNEYIIASQLRNVTHNIVEILDTSYAAGNINPIIGKSYMNANYGSLALYDFMLFDNISTDDKIKELNEYVGIEGNTE